eukprot:m.665227 g.665227  ORF g.665227 m.665227 type:complete len:123 (-) comp58490_c0_seq77:1073-1441(-)
MRTEKRSSEVPGVHIRVSHHQQMLDLALPQFRNDLPNTGKHPVQTRRILLLDDFGRTFEKIDGCAIALFRELHEPTREEGLKLEEMMELAVENPPGRTQHAPRNTRRAVVLWLHHAPTAWLG